MDVNEVLLNEFTREHSGEFLIIILVCLVLVTLLISLPQLLRANLRKAEMMHLENLQAIEKGIPPRALDDRARMAGRTAVLVPMVVMISTAAVTSFLVVYKTTENLFAITLAIWVVGGVVSLAAITGGVALIGRLAQIQAGDNEEVEEDVPEETYMN